MLNLRRSGGSARMANEDLHRQDAKDGQSANDGKRVGAMDEGREGRNGAMAEGRKVSFV